MKNLFGDVCGPAEHGFAYDVNMRRLQAERRAEDHNLKRKRAMVADLETQDRSSPAPQQTQSQLSDAGTQSSDDEFQEAEYFKSRRPQAEAEAPASPNVAEDGAKSKDEAELRNAALSEPETVDISPRTPAPQTGATCFRQGVLQIKALTSTVSSRPTRADAYNAALNGRWDEEVHLRSTTT